MTSGTRRLVVLPALVAALLSVDAARADSAPASPAPPAQMLGFSEPAAAAERAREATADASISRSELRGWLERLAAHPHHVGSAWGRSNAEWMRDLFASWGYEARIESFDVLFPTPVERSLELLGPTPFVAALDEPALAEDATSGQRDEWLPPYNAYSIDGDVTGELVYVNQGLPADYDELAQRGIDVAGKIVIARYGGSWRGIKPKVAAEKGAIGCILYSDPSGDGYFEGDAYPKGGYRSADAVQRGSVADMPIYSGDPLTPGVGATRDAARLPLDAVRVLTKIPVLPISYGDARPLLEALAGPVAPEAWRGALPLTYHLGPGPARVHLKVKFDWSLKPVHDVIAVLPGTSAAAEWIVRGNHHDAWVHGAMDPTSGMVALLAEAKAIGELARSGWRPARTLVFAAWDGEEPGLIGSTEWAETHGRELREKAVVYVNTDSVARGFLGLSGSHTLERFANQVARDVTDPETGVSVLERSRAVRVARERDADRRKELRERADLELGALGSGSDFTPFLQHLGVASLDFGFGGEEQYGQYHSAYDSIDHYLRFGDPDFAYVETTARTGLRVVLRLSEAEVLPFTLERSAEAIAKYVSEVDGLAKKLRAESEERARLLADRTLELAADPTETFVPPQALDRVPYLELAPLENAAALLTAAAERFETAREAAVARGLDPARRASLDAFLRGYERRLLRDAGLPGRPWYRHQIYAPGQYTGYGVKTLPAIREAIEMRRWDEANAQIVAVASLLDAARAAIEEETAKLDG
ncbi:MAG: M28 family peptidase [Acidobacteria bacterium]|nr:M28 family peptidase [Acidobacteriota bacterium]MCB9378240.1 M28 family peptidase [Holophagales bacterium]